MPRYLLCILLAVFAARPAGAGDDIHGVTAVWRDFVASIRRGDYPNAHALFSTQSQNAMPYREFVAEYGPLSVAREMVLAKPDSQATDLDDDWAEITYGGTNPGSGRKFRVGVSFVKNDGVWGLVAARNETAERVEALARKFLRALWNVRREARPAALAEALARAQAESPVMKFYRLEGDGGGFRAFPLQKGFRTFYVDGWGEVKSLEKTPPPKQATAEKLPVPARSALPATAATVPERSDAKVTRRDVMEELSEPPAPRSRRADGNGGASSRAAPDDFAEPPMPAARGRVARPPQVALPDSIR